MPRFHKGTLDHDLNGKMGGSLKETDMTKETTKTPAKAETRTDAAESPRAARKEALAAEQERVAAKFKEADAKGDPSEDEIVGRQVRGW
jgi:hypothetical protein